MTCFVEKLILLVLYPASKTSPDFVVPGKRVMVDENPVARIALFPYYLRQERASVEDFVLGKWNTGCFKKRRNEIGGIH